MSENVMVAEGRTQGRLRRRRTAVMARILVFGATAAVASGLLLGAVVAVTRIKQVTVQSRDASLAREVSQGLQIPPWANLATSKLGRIADQARRCPRVKDVSFERKLPDRLVLTVEPREPCLAFATRGRFLLVDGEGVCTEWTQRPAPAVLRVRGMGVKADVGQRLTGPWFERSLRVAQSVRGADRHRPWTFDVHCPPELSVITGRGARGIVGNCEDLERRIEVFVETLTEYEKLGRRVGLMELRTDKPLAWDEEHRPDKAAG